MVKTGGQSVAQRERACQNPMPEAGLSGNGVLVMLHTVGAMGDVQCFREQPDFYSKLPQLSRQRFPGSPYLRAEKYLLLVADSTPGDFTFWATVAFC